MSSPRVKRVAVIGAGVSGLPTIKHCLEEGFETVCFEMRSDLGGLWNYTENVEKGWSSVMSSTVTNLSKETYCYSDFPAPDDFPVYMPHTKVVEYMRLYAKKFDLDKCILFHSQVDEISQAVDFKTTGRWNVSVKNTKTGTTSLETFHAVCICAGHHSIPYVPKYEGETNFKGSSIHSQEYRDWKNYQGKKVVVVGFGNSACDIACDLSRVCKQTYLSTRGGAWMLSRFAPDGSPNELFYTRRVLEFLISILPASLTNLLMVSLVNVRFNHDILGLEPAHYVLSQKSLMNDDMPSCLISGKIQMKSEIKKLTEDTVVFVDGSSEKVDAVIKATGYEIEFTFVKNFAFEGKDVPSNLYKFVFPTEIYPPTIAAIGYIETQGSFAASAELQSRWAVKVFKGDVKLPSKEDMKAHISSRKKLLIQSTNGNPGFPLSVHLDDIAEEIGCRPILSDLIRSDPLLAMYVFFGPLLPSHYRITGPGAWSGARRTILTVGKRLAAPLKKSGKVVHGNWRTVRLMLVIASFVLVISVFLAIF